MERWRLLLADGCLIAGEPLPRCLGYRPCEHDIIELPLSEDVLRTRHSPVVCFMCLWDC